MKGQCSNFKSENFFTLLKSLANQLALFAARVVESELVESNVFSWSRSRFPKLLESESVFKNCWSRSRFFKTAGVGVGFLKLLELESVFQSCWSLSQESEHLLQLPTPMFIK